MRGPNALIQGDFGKEGPEEDPKRQKSDWDWKNELSLISYGKVDFSRERS